PVAKGQQKMLRKRLAATEYLTLVTVVWSAPLNGSHRPRRALECLPRTGPAPPAEREPHVRNASARPPLRSPAGRQSGRTGAQGSALCQDPYCAGDRRYRGTGHQLHESIADCLGGGG